MASSTTHQDDSQNVAAVLHGPRDIRIERRACPPPAPEEVTIRVRATGLCGSDLHYYLHGRNGDFALQHPMCLGHESVGEVVAVGSKVAETMPQFAAVANEGVLRAVIEPGLNCTACDYCLSGRYNLCPSLRFASSAKTAPHLDGTLQRFFNWPARLVHIIPSTMSLHSAALIEPLAVVLQALSRSHLEAGQSVLIVGAGAVGLLACAAAKAFGASFVAAIDIDEGRLNFAKANGWADATYCTRTSVPPNGANGRNNTSRDSATSSIATSRSEQDQLDMMRAKQQAQDVVSTVSATSDTADLAVGAVQGFDVVYECTGVPACVHMGIFAARTGGRIVLIGMGHPIMAMPLGAAALREVDILGVFRYANMFPKAIRLISSGVLPSGGIRDRHGAEERKGAAEVDSLNTGSTGDIASLVSHTYPLEQTIEAFETLRVGQSPDGKRVVKVFVVDTDEAQGG